MTKSELISRLQNKNTQLKHTDIELVVNSILGKLTSALETGDRVEVRGFGSYQLKRHNSRSSRNPKTGKEFQTPKKMVIRFRPAKALRNRINTNKEKYDIQ